MANNPLRMMGLEVREVGGVRLIIFKATDSAGGNIEMSIPAEAWDAVYEDGATKIMAAANASEPVKAGEWTRSFHREGTPCRVASTDDGKVLLILREGKTTEARQWFDRSHALALSREIFATVERLPAPPEKH